MHLRSEECGVVFYEDEDFAAFTIHLQEIDVLYLVFPKRLLLDSRVVDVPMAYNSTFVMLSSLKPLLFNSLRACLKSLRGLCRMEI
jgi:hypothetical protein